MAMTSPADYNRRSRPYRAPKSRQRRRGIRPSAGSTQSRRKHPQQEARTLWCIPDLAGVGRLSRSARLPDSLLMLQDGYKSHQKTEHDHTENHRVEVDLHKHLNNIRNSAKKSTNIDVHVTLSFTFI